MDYIYFHCLGNLVLLAGGDLQEPNLFHQVQLYGHFPELKCNSLTFNANANCLSKEERGVPPLVIRLCLSFLEQITYHCPCDVHQPHKALNVAPIGRPRVDTSHFFISRSHSKFETPPVFPKTLWWRKCADC